MNTASFLARLSTLAAAGAIEPVDLHFARALAGWADDGVDANVLSAAVLVSHLAGSGHVCADLAVAAEQPLAFDGECSAPSFARWREGLLGSGLCADGENENAPSHPLVLDGHRLYLARHWLNECFVAAELARRVALPLPLDEARLEAALNTFFDPDDVATAGQRQATALAARRRVALISGGPGTGKTTTLAALLALALEQQPDLRILLAAPTGKAAARMQESIRNARKRLPLAEDVAAVIPDEARTLHRLLGFGSGTGRPRYRRDHPLPVDLLVVDEASMVDLALMARVLEALPPRARLVLLGDRDQLASVEAGAVFADLCLSATEGGALAAGYGQLSHSFRFGDDAGIGRLARALREGDADATIALLCAEQADLQWDPVPDAERLISSALAGYGDYLDSIRAGSDAATLHQCFGRFRLLAAHRGGSWGVVRLNAAIERSLAVKLGHDPRQPWYAGRPVMVTANDYALGLFNGDIGIAAPDTDGELRIWFESEARAGLRGIAPHSLPPFEAAWALTVHKSQGSEFDAVLLALPDQPSPLVTCELVYTGVTRARKRVALWGAETVLRDACQRRIVRYSGLCERLREV
ncbi:MAG: exodeoxyribonuclease V subunit alpha [Proteobacteria bacterium]|nr:exodeoxyribonuclease V subunit alpha [Pseudomonadota bacterium]HQR03217.1 exodeoxyribonuclease V subunit alpha [Rhodocyclaceae bacterium]